MANKINFWNENEFVSYEEYASFGISGEMRERNLERSMLKKLNFDQLCPFCFKPLKDGSYKTLITTIGANGATDYYFNPSVKGEQTKVGNGCFKRLIQAYKSKYKKIR